MIIRILDVWNPINFVHCSTVVLTPELQYTYCTTRVLQVHLKKKKKTVFEQKAGPQKKKNIAAGTSFYMEIVNNQLSW